MEYIRDLVLPKPTDEKKQTPKTATPAAPPKDDEKKAAETTDASVTAPSEEGEKSPTSKQNEIEVEKDVNLNWFLNYILTKRISAQN